MLTQNTISIRLCELMVTSLHYEGASICRSRCPGAGSDVRSGRVSAVSAAAAGTAPTPELQREAAASQAPVSGVKLPQDPGPSPLCMNGEALASRVRSG